MKEMEYTGMTEKPVSLGSDTYKGYIFHIVSYGSHPSAYIEIPKGHKLYGRTIYKYEKGNPLYAIHCHGGITFAEHAKKHILYPDADENERIYVIGWDYAHAGDYIYYGVPSIDKFNVDGWKYTVADITADAHQVIDQIC